MWRQSRLPIVWALIDTLAFIAALVIASILRPYSPVGRPLYEVWWWPTPLWVAIPVLWIVSVAILQGYDPRSNVETTDEIRHLTFASGLAFLLTSGLMFFSYREQSRLQVLFFTILATGFLLGGRLILRWLLARRGLRVDRPRRILIVGANPLALHFAQVMKKFTEIGLEIIGFVDDEPALNLPAPCLGSLDDIPRIVREHLIDEVIIALPPQAYDRVRQVVAIIYENTDANVRMIPDVFPLAFLQISVEDFGGIPLITLREPVLSPFQRLIKRILDIVVSISLLFLLAPVMMVVALLIKLDSRGPVVFKQQRVGEGGRLFWMYKFRTMVANAEAHQHKVIIRTDDGTIIHKRPDDPRVTRIGRFLRRWSLDELPQLWNVLKGDMSLVGPRPEMPWLVEKYEPWQRKRFTVPQGITGWWQVTGRSDKPMHLHTEEDLLYIRNYSIWLDLVILWKTIGAVIRRKGAF